MKGEAILLMFSKYTIKSLQHENGTIFQIAMNWLISQPNIVKLSKLSINVHLKENLGALDFTNRLSNV